MCKPRGTGIIGVGLPYIVTYKSQSCSHERMTQSAPEYRVLSPLPLYLFCYPPKSQSGTGSLGLAGSTGNIWPALHFTQAESGLCCHVTGVCTRWWRVGVGGQSQLTPGLSSGLFFAFLYRKGSRRNWKGPSCRPSPFPDWQGPHALHRSHHHGGAEADDGSAACHSSYDLRENSAPRVYYS